MVICMSLIGVAVLFFVSIWLYVVVVCAVIELFPPVWWLLTLPYTLPLVILKWAQRRIYGEDNENRAILREVVAHLICATVYVLIALHFDTSTTVTVLAAIFGLTITYD